jgi:hypothetical protein
VFFALGLQVIGHVLEGKVFGPGLGLEGQVLGLDVHVLVDITGSLIIIVRPHPIINPPPRKRAEINTVAKYLANKAQTHVMK